MALVVLTSPTPAAQVNSAWGAPRAYRGGVHEGLDFPGPVGSPILAAADGVAVQVKNVSDSFAGKFVAIEHAGGVVSRYLHNLENFVKLGETVKRGQQIASLGKTGTSGNSAPHLHFDIKLSPAALQEYISRFGRPAGGFGAKTGHGTGAPAESLMAGVKYSDQARARSLALGVHFRRPGEGVGVALVAAGAAVGYLLSLSS